MSSVHFRVRLTDRAKDDLRRIGKKYGKKTYETIRDLIRGLEFDPEKQGEPLQGILRGLYSLHYSRFRLIYRIDKEEFVVLVVAGGYHKEDSRTDIYKLIERALESGRLVIHEEKPADSSDSSREE